MGSSESWNISTRLVGHRAQSFVGSSSGDESARQKLSTDFQVPNIVHYIWYYNDSQPMKFHEMLSVLSAHKMLQPDAIYFHTNVPPSGKYWERLRELKNFKVSDNYCEFESFHYSSHVCINHWMSNVPKLELNANQTFKIVIKYVFYFHSKTKNLAAKGYKIQGFIYSWLPHYDSPYLYYSIMVLSKCIDSWHLHWQKRVDKTYEGSIVWSRIFVILESRVRNQSELQIRSTPERTQGLP